MGRQLTIFSHLPGNVLVGALLAAVCQVVLVSPQEAQAVTATVTATSGPTATPDPACVDATITASITVNATAPGASDNQTLVAGSESLTYSYDWDAFSSTDASSVTGSYSSPGTKTISVTVTVTVSGTADYSYTDENGDPQTSTEDVRGSGEIEGAAKHVVSNRLKNAGMRWSEEGADATIAARCTILNETWGIDLLGANLN